MKPCYGCKKMRRNCAGTCEEYHGWMHGLLENPEELKRQRSIDGHVLYRDLNRRNL